MKLLNYNGETFSIEIDKDELLLINNVLNEICNGVHIDDWDFEIRLGVSKEKGRILLKQFDPLFNMNADQNDSDDKF